MELVDRVKKRESELKKMQNFLARVDPDTHPASAELQESWKNYTRKLDGKDYEVYGCVKLIEDTLEITFNEKDSIPWYDLRERLIKADIINVPKDSSHAGRRLIQQSLLHIAPEYSRMGVLKLEGKKSEGKIYGVKWKK